MDDEHYDGFVSVRYLPSAEHPTRVEIKYYPPGRRTFVLTLPTDHAVSLYRILKYRFDKGG